MSVYDINYAPNTGAQNPTGAYFQQPQIATPPSSLATTPGGFQAPTMGTAGTPLGMNLGTANLVLGGIGTLGNLWAAFQAQKLAKEQFNYQKDITDTNLANQIQSYNTALSDRINSRGFIQGDSQSTIDQYIEENSLRDRRNR